ncbi:MAG TPA: MBL fold metallo-hydrolase [Candidatus Caldiarchaeum subterraneum]|uniref:MBL fold metallo-hydrolase n=1 Tax=Caldiarchaeum subterraneum TaxID=311458 RepID=A0A833EA35_CALS0|nr:MBL fold metallo-hydrolase [Candidatus Caldarchaeum subterraneum]
MRVTILGAGSIFPTQSRFASSLLLEVDGLKFLMDCGPGTLEKLRRLGVKPTELNAVFITHFHLDHFSDTLPLIMARAYDEEGKPATSPRVLDIIGPKGIVELIKTITEKIFPYLSNTMLCQRYLNVLELVNSIYEAYEGVKVRSVEVEHYNGVAYRVETGGKSLVYSGDTLPDERLVKLAEGCDVLIHECSFPHSMLVGKHTSDKQLVDIVERVKPKLLVVTHLYPAWIGFEEELKKTIQDSTGVKTIIAEDFTTLEL